MLWILMSFTLFIYAVSETFDFITIYNNSLANNMNFFILMIPNGGLVNLKPINRIRILQIAHPFVHWLLLVCHDHFSLHDTCILFSAFTCVIYFLSFDLDWFFIFQYCYVWSSNCSLVLLINNNNNTMEHILTQW